MIEEKYLTEDYGRTITEKGFVLVGLNSADDFSLLSGSLLSVNCPREYQFFLNKITYRKVEEFLGNFIDYDPVGNPDRLKIEPTIINFCFYGIEYTFKRNQINNLNIGIPLNLIFVTPENSVIVETI